jgi:NDP-sugar pyrophosphorylase family protein
MVDKVSKPAEAVNFFILCGGLATRMRAVAQNKPKSLLPLAGRPFLEHLLDRVVGDALPYLGRVVFCVGYMSDQIEEFVRSRDWPFEVGFSTDGETPLGTGGSFRDSWKKFPSELAVVTYGDSFIHYPIADMCELLAGPKHYEGIMTVFHNRGQFDQSNVRIDGNTVTKYSKSSVEDCDYIDYGLSLVKSSILKTFPTQGAFDLSAPFEGLSTEGKLGALTMQKRFYEIGSQQGYEELNELMSGHVSDSV